MKTRSGRKYEEGAPQTPTVSAPKPEPKSKVKSVKKTPKESTTKKTDKTRQTVEKTAVKSGRKGRSAKDQVQQEVVEELPQKDEDVDMDVDIDVNKDINKGVNKDVAKKVTKSVSKSVTKNVTKVVTKNVVKDVTKEVPKDVKEVAKEVIVAETPKVTETTRRGRSAKVIKEDVKEVVKEGLKKVAKKVTKRVIEDIKEVEKEVEIVVEKVVEKEEKPALVVEKVAEEPPVKKLKAGLVPIPSIGQNFGQLFSFGEEIAGELGLRLKKVDSKKLRSNEPSVVTDEDEELLSDVVSVVCGEMHSCIVRSDGRVFTFGCNDDKALGRPFLDEDNEEEESKTPKSLPELPPIVKVSAGDFHTCALAQDGRVFVWGNFRDESKKFGLFVDDMEPTPVPKQLNLDDRVADIASGVNHILLLTEDGDVLSFGDGTVGQLGRIEEKDLNSIEVNRELFLKPQKVDFGQNKIEKIWANHWSCFAKTTSGDIYVWGLNNYHQLGFKSQHSVEKPNSDQNVSLPTNKFIVELKPVKSDAMPANTVMIANGQHHMLALDQNGRVFSCGSSTYGKLGFKTNNSDMTAENPSLLDEKLFDGQKLVHIFCGNHCSYALTESGQLFSWGQGSNHIGSAFDTDIEEPTRVKGQLADDVRFIDGSAGSQHCLLIGLNVSINGNINKN